MIPAYYLLIVFVSQAILTWLALRIMADEHRTTVNALMSKNPQELKMLEAPVPARPPLRRIRRMDTEFEGEFSESAPRPLGL